MKILNITIILSLMFLNIPHVLAEVYEIRDIAFPTTKDTLILDNFGDPRPGGRLHEGVDIMGDQMTPLYSAVDGVLKSVVSPEASWGYAITIQDDDGYTYHYIHINNDTPGTNDGLGGEEQAYAPGIEKGASVKKGDLIAWMGNSGNAEGVGHHLHFEIRRPDKTPIDSYESLIIALKGGPNYSKTSFDSLTINEDKGLSKNPDAKCISGSMIKLTGSDAVYYCGSDGKRYAFPNEKIYFTWYDGFEGIVEVSLEEIADISLGGNVTYKPGARLVKLQTNPKVYAVDNGGVLRWITSSEVAESIYGPDWNTMIDDMPDSFFFNYTIGEDIK